MGAQLRQLPLMCFQRSFCAWALALAAVLCSLSGSAFAELGLNVSLNTSGYEFPIASATATLAREGGHARKADVAAQSFRANAVIANLSRENVPFSFPNPVSAARHWTFRVLDSTGAQVWVSDTDDGATPIATPQMLPAHRAWRRSIQVPLIIDGTPLAVGRYTLQATIAGDPSVGATSVFTVTSADVPGNTGIKGQVLRSLIEPLAVASAGSNTTANQSIAFPIGVGVKATLTVTQVLDATANGETPFTWTGVTDDSGNYQVATPVGKFTVTAVAYVPPVTTGTVSSHAASILPTPIIGDNFYVIVTAGKYTVHNIYLPGGVIDPPPPPVDTGVTGTVTQASSDADGIPTPLAGATVQLRPQLFGPIPWNESVTLYYPLRTVTTTTDENGQFTLDDFAGTYRLTVYADVVPGVFDPTTSMPVAFASVTVTSGQFTNVTLEAPAPISPAAVPVSSITSLQILATGTSVVGGTPQEILSAQGTVPGPGWTGAALRPRASANPLVLEFDFVAVPPSAGASVARANATISASIPCPSTEVNVIRVYSATNSQELDFALPMNGAPSAQ